MSVVHTVSVACSISGLQSLLHHVETDGQQEHEDEEVHRRLTASLQRVLPEELVRGGALQHCQVPTDRVHRPSFYLLRSSAFALEQNLACAARSDMHNESQRLGFWHHLLPGETLKALLRQRDLSVDNTAVWGQSPLQAMYKHFSRLTKLPTAADAFAQSDQAQLSSFVSTSYGELVLSSVDKMVACMIQHGVHPKHDLFFDVGSGYGRVVCHVALATAMTHQESKLYPLDIGRPASVSPPAERLIIAGCICMRETSWPTFIFCCPLLT